jgi:hypothetical protein
LSFYFFYITRKGSCSSNKVCCPNENINIVSTTQETPVIDEPNHNYVRSCGIGKSPTDTMYSERIGTRIVNPEGSFMICLNYKITQK